ncbi:hypothetical protein E2320_016285 [Naja naja]|nr:hypothetical protein E2320_016285 [Naja naja]
MIIKEYEVNEEYIGKGRIGKIYRILTELEEQAKGLKLIWESDLEEINDNDWKNIWNRRVYKNMSELRKMDIKCEKQVGAYTRMWWNCDSAQKIWDMVFKELRVLCM